MLQGTRVPPWPLGVPTVNKNDCSTDNGTRRLSNGGGFVGTLACSAVGGEFAALAPVAGAFYTDTNGPENGCAPGRKPLPILEFHGGADKTVLYAGGKGEGGIEPPITDWYGNLLLSL
jgi:hypothetical protein